MEKTVDRKMLFFWGLLPDRFKITTSPHSKRRIYFGEEANPDYSFFANIEDNTFVFHWYINSIYSSKGSESMNKSSNFCSCLEA